MICLSYDGKIVMGNGNDIMDFFTRLISEKMSGLQLRDAIKVELAGLHQSQIVKLQMKGTSS